MKWDLIRVLFFNFVVVVVSMTPHSKSGSWNAFWIQVIRENGSSEVLNKLYDTAMDKLEGVKKEYDVLSKRYSEKVASHNTDLSRLEQVEEENRRLQKQIDALLKQRDTAIQYQQQWSTSMRRYEQHPSSLLCGLSV